MDALALLIDQPDHFQFQARLGSKVLRFLVVMLFPQMVDCPPIEVSGQIKPLQRAVMGSTTNGPGQLQKAVF